MPSFIKDTMKGKDEQKFEEMKKEIHDAVHGEGSEEPEGVSPYAASEDAEAPETEVPAGEVLQKELDQLKETLAAEKERSLRLQADFENFRRRTAKEKEELAAVITQFPSVFRLPFQVQGNVTGPGLRICGAVEGIMG